MQVQVQLQNAQNSGIQFGSAIDTPTLYYANFKVKNGIIIKVGYVNHHTIINQLINTYKSITTIQQHVHSILYLKITTGQYKNMLATNSQKLSFYEFSRDQNPSFQVYNENQIDITTEALHSNAKYQQLQSKNKQLNINLILNGNKYKIKIKNNDKIDKIKQKIRKQFNKQLENIVNNQISLMIKGIFINDTIRNNYLEDNCQMNVVIKQKHGCFQRHSKVIKVTGQTLVEESIGDIKINDEVLTYNQEFRKFQHDTVTYVSTYMLDQYLLIELENGIQIKTTGNHLFQCQDDIYRKCQRSLRQQIKDSTLLSIGTKLKLYNYIQSPIKSIKKIYLPQPQPFYHLSIHKNHNFIINNTIAHNMFVNIILPDNTIQKINISPSQLILNIKQQLQQMYSIQSHSQALFYAGKIINDYQTLVDRNIPKQSNIYLRYKSIDDFNYLRSKTKILMSNGHEKLIQQIKQGQNICCSNGKEDTVLAIQKKQLNNYMVASLNSYDTQIVVSKDCYLQLPDGTSTNIFDICYKMQIQNQPTLQNYNNKQCKVIAIAHHKTDQTKTFYKLLINNQSNYIANGCIINNLIINIIFFKNNKRINKLCLPFNKNDKVYQLKAKITKILDLDQDIQLSFDGQILNNQKYLCLDYNLNSSNVLIANSNNASIHSSLKITNKPVKVKRDDKIFMLQVSFTEIISLQYIKYAHKAVSNIIEELLPKFASSSYFFVFSDIVILPYQILNKLEDSQEFQGADNTILLIKNEKWAFIQSMQLNGNYILSSSFNLLQNTIPNNQSKSNINLKVPTDLSILFNKASLRIQNDNDIATKYKKQAFYMPFLYYTSKRYKTVISDYIKNFYKNVKKQGFSNNFGEMVKEIYANMCQLKNVYDECYFGIKNFRFSRFYKVRDIFYWLTFTSASPKSQKIQIQIYKNKGTLFIIQSINGKNITPFSVYPDNPQILFAPFTYFMVQKIQIKDAYDIVYLSEMSSPLTFQKNIILWVDDKPKNNAAQIQQLLKTNNIQILQVTSTLIAINWVKQFGWLLNWKGFNFKLISNMSRFEHFNTEINSYAGVDLLQKLYIQYGITAQTLIYCGDEKKANQKIKQRKIQHNKFKVTSKIHRFKQFCKISI